jgi:methionyl-tRNA formyltransferase
VARLVFLGSPAPAVVALRALVAAGHDVALVVSRADTRRGRGGAHAPSPVKAAAVELGIATTDRLDDAVDAGAELGVVVAYGRIIPGRVLDALPMLNIHFSLLPRWRGAAPVERAILAGDDTTGVCIMRLDEGLDTGPVLACRTVPTDDLHAGALTERLARVGAELLVELLAGGVAALGPGEPQQGEATYAEKLTAEEMHLRWDQPAARLERVVRLDRAWTTCGGRRLRVLEARAAGVADHGPSAAFLPGDRPGTLRGELVRAGEGALELLLVQPEGKRPMPAAEWRRGARLHDGEQLGGAEHLGGAGSDR